MDIVDAFISIDGYVYVNDAGAIRTIDDAGIIRTLYGQKKDFGDGANATAARFDDVQTFKVWDNAGTLTLVALDKVKFRFREFTVGGNINTIIGNGSDSTFTIGGSGLQPLDNVSWGPLFEIHPTSGDIFFHRNAPATLWDRSADTWISVYGGTNGSSVIGTPGWIAPDGEPGSSLDWNGRYPPRIIGIDSATRRVLYAETDYNYGTITSTTSFLFTMDFNASYTAATYSYVLGLNQDDDDSDGSHFCPDGTLAASCSLSEMAIIHNSGDIDNPGVRGQFEANSNTWLVHEKELEPRRIAQIAKGVNIATFTTLDNDAINFEYRMDGGTEYIYYCGMDNNIYKRNVTAGTETQIIPDTPGIACIGEDLHYDATRDTLMFIFKENNMSAIGEVLNP